MRKTLTIFGAVFLVFSWFTTARALELYSIIHSNCRSVTGLIIHVDSTKLYLLNQQGELITLKTQGIEHILVYNTLDNPIRRLDLNGELKEYLRKVDVQGDAENDFTGWPIRFLEDLIVFFDVEGKTHLVNIDMIQGFEVPDLSAVGMIGIDRHEVYRFGFGSNLSACESSAIDPGEVVHPTRMISDPIAVSKFLKVYENGFTKLNRFQKRTTFYARPYLYEKKTKVGIVVDREDFQQELPGYLPLSFQWATGSNYGPQGILNLGAYLNPKLPNVEPTFAVNFSGKYHFLSVLFSGNIWGFSYGQHYIVENRSAYKDFFARRDEDDLLVFPQYNQLAMTGLEWGSYSFSAGYYYPIIGMQANGVFREILSQQSMPIINLKYTTESSSLEFLLSDIAIKSNSPSEQDIKLIFAEEMAQSTTLTQSSKDLIDQLDRFDLRSQFLRVNYDLDLNRDVRLGLSEVFFQGNYEEDLSGSAYKLNYRQYITSVRLQQEFGDYISLKGYLNYFIRHYQSQSSDHDKDIEENKVSFTVVVEFIL